MRSVQGPWHQRKPAAVAATSLQVEQWRLVEKSNPAVLCLLAVTDNMDWNEQGSLPCPLPAMSVFFTSYYRQCYSIFSIVYINDLN